MERRGTTQDRVAPSMLAQALPAVQPGFQAVALELSSSPAPSDKLRAAPGGMYKANETVRSILVRDERFPDFLSISVSVSVATSCVGNDVLIHRGILCERNQGSHVALHGFLCTCAKECGFEPFTKVLYLPFIVVIQFPS